MPARGSVIESREVWDALVRSFEYPHILQSWTWGEHKQAFGWSAERLVWGLENGTPDSCALILTRTRQILGRRFSVLYVPKGPLLDWSDPAVRSNVLSTLERKAQESSAILIKIDPDLPLAYGQPGANDYRANPVGDDTIAALVEHGWRPSHEAVQFRNTMVVDLTRSPDDILADMKQKTRYNVRLASRRGVETRRGGLGDLESLYAMYAETSLRDDFVIRDRSYYLSAWEKFIAAGIAEPIIAEVKGEPVAAVIPFAYGHKAWYLYGMSTDAHREKMPNYLLQWEAIRWAVERGCTEYDLWGAPDEFSQADPLWGVFRFKRGFGARIVCTIGPWDWTPRPLIYTLYTRVMPFVLGIMRSRGTHRTAMDLEG